MHRIPSTAIHRLRRPSILAATLLCLFASAVPAAESHNPASVSLVPIADTYIATYPGGSRNVHKKDSEQGGNAGTTEKLKIKKFEYMPIFKFDFSSVPKGASITDAYIDLHLMHGAMLNQVSISSLHTDWNEGKGNFDNGKNLTLDHNGACFVGPKGIDSSWRSYPDSDFFLSFNGEGGSAMCISQAKMLDAETCRIPIDPLIIEAAIENGSSLVLDDHTGIFIGAASNIFFYSRETNEHSKVPLLHVSWSDQADKTAPAFRGEASASAGAMAGSILLNLPEAGDDGSSGTAVGYHVWIDDKPVDRRLVPRPQRIDRRFLVDGLSPGKQVQIKIEAYDEAGNTCSSTISAQTCADFTGTFAPALADQTSTGKVVSAGPLSAQLIDGMTLINPLTGKIADKQIRSQGLLALQRLAAVKGETLGIQCLLTNNAAGKDIKDLSISATDLRGQQSANGSTIAANNIEFFNEVYVKMHDNWIADILPSLAAKETFSIPSQPDIKEQRAHVIYTDIYIPKTTPTGLYSGQIVVHSAGGDLTLPVEVMVRDVTLPDKLGFIVEMNAYGHSDNKNIFHETYRLCHKNRLSYNVLGYAHTRPGTEHSPVLNSDKNPKIAAKDIKITDWTAYDDFYGPLFSGDITKGLPRAGEPASHWYLPFHDGWPYSLEKSHPELWKGRVAPKEDKKAFKKWQQSLAENDLLFADHLSADWQLVNKNVGAEFAAHFAKKGWTKTSMELFNNHKFYFGGGSQSLWVMDEPQVGRDFEALAGIYRIQGADLSSATDGKKEMNLTRRADISRPQEMGSFMDNAVDQLCVSSLAALYKTYLTDYINAHNIRLWWYGGGAGADTDPTAVIALFTNKWSTGCVGGLPEYTAFGGSNDWSKTDGLRIVRFDKKGMPVPSFRLKAYRRGQQDMELLTMLEKKSGFNRWHLASLIEKDLPLNSTTVSTGPDDPGYSTFEDLDVASFNTLREKVVATLLANK